MSQNSKVDEGAARKRGSTPEYEDAWERLFGKGREQKENQEYAQKQAIPEQER